MGKLIEVALLCRPQVPETRPSVSSGRSTRVRKGPFRLAAEGLLILPAPCRLPDWAETPTTAV
jgi:hypothetical protein